MARLSSSESVIKKLSGIHEKIEELFDTIEQVKAVRDRINGLVGGFEQKNSQLAQILNDAPRQIEAEKAKAQKSVAQMKAVFQSLRAKEQKAFEHVSELEKMMAKTESITHSFVSFHHMLEAVFADLLTAVGIDRAALKNALDEVEAHRKQMQTGRAVSDDLPHQVRMLTEEMAWLQQEETSGLAGCPVFQAADHYQEVQTVQNALTAFQLLAERVEEEFDHFSDEMAVSQLALEKDFVRLSSRLNIWQKNIRQDLSENIEALFSCESRRFENELELRIDHLNVELKATYSTQKRVMTDLIASLQEQSDELMRLYEAAGQKANNEIFSLKDELESRLNTVQETQESSIQDVGQKIVSLKNEFQSRFEELDAFVKDDQKIVELEKSFQSRFEELKSLAEDDCKIIELDEAIQTRLDEFQNNQHASLQSSTQEIESQKSIFQTRLDELNAAIEDNQKIAALENSFQARFEKLEAAVNDEQKIIDVNTALQARLDELKAVIDKTDSGAFDKIGKLEKSLRNRLDEQQKTNESSTQQIESLKNEFQNKLTELEAAVTDEQKIAELERAIQSRLDEQQKTNESSTQQIESLKNEFQNKLNEIEAAVNDEQKIAELENAIQNRLDEQQKTNESSTQQIESLKNEFQSRLNELEAAIKDDQKFSALENSFQTRFEKLDAAVNDEQKIIDVKTALQTRMDELKAAMDKTDAGAFDKIDKLEKAVRSRLVEQQKTNESSKQKIESLENEFQNKLNELEAADNDEQKIAEFESAIQSRLDEQQKKNEFSTQKIESLKNEFKNKLNELEAAIKGDHKFNELENSFQTRFKELEAAVSDEQKIIDTKATLQARQDELKSAMDKANAGAFEKIGKLEESLRNRLDEQQKASESSTQKIESLINEFQSKLNELEAAGNDEQKIVELENAIQSRLDEQQKKNESSTQQIESLKNEFQNRLEKLEAAVKDGQKIEELKAAFQTRFEKLETTSNNQKVIQLEKNIQIQTEKFKDAILAIKNDSLQRFSGLKNAVKNQLNDVNARLESERQSTLSLNQQMEKNQSELAERNKQFQKGVLQKISQFLSDKIKQIEHNVQSETEKAVQSVLIKQNDIQKQFDEQLAHLATQIKECAEHQQHIKTHQLQQHDALKQNIIKISERQNTIVKALNLQEKRLSSIETRLKPGPKPKA